MDDRELQVLKDALREHVHALAVDIGPRTPSIPGSLVRAANYIHAVLEDAGLSVRGAELPIPRPARDECARYDSKKHRRLRLLRGGRSLRYGPEHARCR